VHPEVVLTAAHCVAGLTDPLPRMVVAFGAEMKQALAAGRSATREVVALQVHPGFEKLWRKRGSPQSYEAGKRAYKDLAKDGVAGLDLALLLLHRAAPETHRPATLGTVKRGAFSDRLVIAGYGRTGRADDNPDSRLRFAVLPRGRLGDRLDSTAIWVDAGISGGQRVNVCPGDSGGAIFLDDGRTSRLVGVAAAGDAGCREISGFSAISAQQVVLRGMFDQLTNGMAAQRENPF